MKHLLLILALMVALSCPAQNYSGKIISKSTTQMVKSPAGNIYTILELPAKIDTNKKYPVVIICHGLTAYCNRPLLTALADSLALHDVVTIRFDFCGHGSSYGTITNMTIPKEVNDLKFIYEFACHLPFADTKRISVVGHSQGGTVAALFAGEMGTEKVAKMALIAPGGAIEEMAQKGEFLKAKFDPNNIPDKVIVLNQPLGRSYFETAKTIDVYGHAARYGGPVCIVHGTGDKTVPVTYGMRFKDACPTAELHLLDGDNHNLTHHTAEALHLLTAFLTK